MWKQILYLWAAGCSWVQPLKWHYAPRCEAAQRHDWSRKAEAPPYRLGPCRILSSRTRIQRASCIAVKFCMIQRLRFYVGIFRVEWFDFDVPGFPRQVFQRPRVACRYARVWLLPGYVVAWLYVCWDGASHELDFRLVQYLIDCACFRFSARSLSFTVKTIMTSLWRLLRFCPSTGCYWW